MHRRNLIGMAAAIAVTCSLSAAPAGAQTTLRLGHPEAPTHPFELSSKYLAEIVAQRSGGKLKIEVFGQSQLGGQSELVESLQTGAVDMAIVAGGFLASFFPRTQVFDLPFLFKDAAAAEKLLDGPIGQDLFKDMAAKNIVGLAWGTAGFRHIQNGRRPVVTPADIKGLRIRIQPSPLFAAMFEAVGAVPVPIAWAETYTALQQKTIDGLEVPVAAVLANKMYEVTKYVSLSAHSYNIAPIMASKRRFDLLPADQRELLTTASREAALHMRKLFAEGEQKQLDELKSKGMEVANINFVEFRTAMSPVYDRFKSRIGAEFVDQVLAASR